MNTINRPLLQLPPGLVHVGIMGFLIWPEGGVREEVLRSLKLTGFILWGALMCPPNVMPFGPLTFEICFLGIKCWPDRQTSRK